ncbi:hypothetical protein [Methanobacterium aggregans]|uniref:hypothetical protein n=1 Tax=Methanobacterium aggregans TaxID=1615586 RepID=UPI0032107CC0|nr:hypothetical protein [Methanobacterium aggregans]
MVLLYRSNAGKSLDLVILANLIISILTLIFLFIIGSIGGILGAGIRKKLNS